MCFEIGGVDEAVGHALEHVRAGRWCPSRRPLVMTKGRFPVHPSGRSFLQRGAADLTHRVFTERLTLSHLVDDPTNSPESVGVTSIEMKHEARAVVVALQPLVNIRVVKGDGMHATPEQGEVSEWPWHRINRYPLLVPRLHPTDALTT